MNKKQDEIVMNLMYNHAPFGIYDDLGMKVKMYPNAKEAYKDALMYLWIEFPLGYIDMPLFIYEYQQVPIRDAERRCINRELFHIDLANIEDKKRVQQLRDVFAVLLRQTGCEFDENSFQGGLFEFNKWLINAKVKERLEDGSVYKFIELDEHGKSSQRNAEGHTEQ